jgi:hypothetical protein
VTDTFLADLREYFDGFIARLEANPAELKSFIRGEWCLIAAGPDVVVDADVTDLAPLVTG